MQDSDAHPIPRRLGYRLHGLVVHVRLQELFQVGDSSIKCSLTGGLYQG